MSLYFVLSFDLFHSLGFFVPFSSPWKLLIVLCFQGYTGLIPKDKRQQQAGVEEERDVENKTAAQGNVNAAGSRATTVERLHETLDLSWRSTIPFLPRTSRSSSKRQKRTCGELLELYPSHGTHPAGQNAFWRRIQPVDMRREIEQEPQQDTRQLMTNNQENELSRLLFQ